MECRIYCLFIESGMAAAVFSKKLTEHADRFEQIALRIAKLKELIPGRSFTQTFEFVYSIVPKLQNFGNGRRFTCKKRLVWTLEITSFS